MQQEWPYHCLPRLLEHSKAIPLPDDLPSNASQCVVPSYDAGACSRGYELLVGLSRANYPPYTLSFPPSPAQGSGKPWPVRVTTIRRPAGRELAVTRLSWLLTLLTKSVVEGREGRGIGWVVQRMTLTTGKLHSKHDRLVSNYTPGGRRRLHAIVPSMCHSIHRAGQGGKKAVPPSKARMSGDRGLKLPPDVVREARRAKAVTPTEALPVSTNTPQLKV